MKYWVIFLSLLMTSQSQAYTCSHFEGDARKMETLNFVAKKIFRYNQGAEEFCQKEGFLDLELYAIPNYFRLNEENDDHYKLMVHYDYKSCTFIYNITKKHITEKGCYSTW